MLPSPPPPPAQQGYIGCAAGRENNHVLVEGVSKMWTGVTEGGATGSFSIGTTAPFNGAQYQTITYSGGTSGALGVANYGVNCQLGMHIVGDKLYEGYIYLRTPAAATTPVMVNLRMDRGSASTQLAGVAFKVLTHGQWQRYNFTLSTTGGSQCSAHTQRVGGSIQDLYSCDGRFVVVALTPHSSLDVDLVYLTPGAWAQMPSPTSGTIGLPARKDVAIMLQL